MRANLQALAKGMRHMSDDRARELVRRAEEAAGPSGPEFLAAEYDEGGAEYRDRAKRVRARPPVGMTRIYFDTEFTGLRPDAALISIGLVDERGAEFYAELSDTYQIEDCSDFCRKEVIPHLEGGNVRRTLGELRQDLLEWLTARGPAAVLICDSPRDVTQLSQLLPTGMPPNVQCQALGWWGNLQRRLFNRGRRIHRRLGLRVHHALDDARVNRIVLGRRA